MKLSNTALVALKRYFPRSWATILRDRIYRKHGVRFSINYIRYVLDESDPRHNDLIVEEAHIYHVELKKAILAAEAEILD